MLSHLKLYKAIKQLKSVSTSKYIVDELFKDAELTGSRWFNYKSYESKDKPNYTDAHTYSKCTSTEIETINDNIIIILTIWSGNSFDGSKCALRCQYRFKLPYTKLKSTLYKYISDLVESEFKIIAIRLYDDEQEQIKNARINELYKNMLDKI
jgi:hypothetical protein